MTDHQEFMAKLEDFVLRMQSESIKGLSASIGVHPATISNTKTIFYKLGMPRLTKAAMVSIPLSDLKSFLQWKASQEDSP